MVRECVSALDDRRCARGRACAQVLRLARETCAQQDEIARLRAQLQQLQPRTQVRPSCRRVGASRACQTVHCRCALRGCAHPSPCSARQEPRAGKPSRTAERSSAIGGQGARDGVHSPVHEVNTSVEIEAEVGVQIGLKDIAEVLGDDDAADFAEDATDIGSTDSAVRDARGPLSERTAAMVQVAPRLRGGPALAAWRCSSLIVAFSTFLAALPTSLCASFGKPFLEPSPKGLCAGAQARTVVSEDAARERSASAFGKRSPRERADEARAVGAGVAVGRASAAAVCWTRTAEADSVDGRGGVDAAAEELAGREESDAVVEAGVGQEEGGGEDAEEKEENAVEAQTRSAEAEVEALIGADVGGEDSEDVLDDEEETQAEADGARLAEGLSEAAASDWGVSVPAARGGVSSGTRALAAEARAGAAARCEKRDAEEAGQAAARGRRSLRWPTSAAGCVSRDAKYLSTIMLADSCKKCTRICAHECETRSLRILPVAFGKPVAPTFDCSARSSVTLAAMLASICHAVLLTFRVEIHKVGGL
eukprot:6209349-Pleurochrysis_carterae.AAC.2